MMIYRITMEHHVYFWLNEEKQNPEGFAEFEKGLEALCLSSNIASSHWARPAATAERPVTDHSFHYGASLKFDSMEAHNRYQEGDSVHEEFVATFKEWWSKVLVMDLA